jgi:hypothetical protein
MAPEFPDPLTPNFTVSLTQADGKWVLHCEGFLEVAEAAQILQPRLLELHRAVLEAKIPLVRVDIQAVEYMNSSGLKSFMAWFLAAANASSDVKYIIEVGYDPRRKWQQTSLRPMERLAPETVRLIAA